MSVSLSPPTPTENLAEVASHLAMITAPGGSTPGRARAITMLASQHPAQAVNVLALLATDGDEQATVRRLAVDSLARIDDPKVHGTLVAVLGDADAGVAGRAAIALGRVGRPEALPALDTLGQADSESVLVARARFAAAVIAHRFDLADHDLPSPAQADHLDVSGRARRAKVAPAPPEVAAAARAGVASTMPDFRSGGPAPMVTCGDHREVMVFTEGGASVLDQPGRMRERRWHLGQLAYENPTNGLFSAGLTVLSTPNGDGVDVGLYRSDGTLVYGGTGAFAADAFVATLSAAHRPGAVAVTVDVAVKGGAVDLKVRTDAGVRVEPKEPEPARR